MNTSRIEWWGWAVVPALAALLILSPGCTAGDDTPAAEPVPDYQPPERSIVDGTPVLLNQEARARLLVRDHRPERPARLLFLGGRASSPAPDGGALWADPDGGRVIVFDEHGRVSEILQGDGSVSTPEPFLARAVREGTEMFERGGNRLVLRTDGTLEPEDGSLPAPVTGASPEFLAASRSPLHLPLAPVRPDAPLLWLASDATGQAKGLGTVRLPHEPMLGYLENSGWALPAPDGGAYFASAIRPELLRLSAEGTVRWTSRWAPPEPVMEPRIEAVDGSARAAFQILQHAAALGHDGHVYLLVAPDVPTRADLLLVFDGKGELVRTGIVPDGYAIFEDRRGVVYAVPPEQALADPRSRDRPSFAAFELPRLAEAGTIDLEEYRGRVVVVNFWASWCPPCQREIPALEALYRELDPDDAVVIGLNEDRRPEQARSFLDELGDITYPNALGEGALRRTYGYRGLPYTLVLDRNLRVAHSFYGFGSSLEPVRRAVLEEVERAAHRQ